jgi:phosphate transport system permease protein
LRKLEDKILMWLGVIFAYTALGVLAVLVIDTFLDALPRLNIRFLTSYPSRIAENSGILPALVGSLWVGSLTALISFPLGVLTGVYMEEYAKRNVFTEILDINISNLAGVPSIIYGLLGLEVFVRFMGLGRSIISGALTLSLLVLPIIVISTREAIRAVPESIREASYALGATKWQTVFYQVLPAAMPGILTGFILAISRALGESAPLITIGALTFIAFLPESIFDPFTVLPIQIFNWISRPQREFASNAAAGIIVLLILVFSLNFIAIYLRAKYERLRKW